MAGINLRLFLFSAFAVAALCVSAQTDPGLPAGHVKIVPAPGDADQAAGGRIRTLPAPELVPNGVPFAIENPKGPSSDNIRILSEDKMTRADRDLVADAESSIRERAGFENLDFNGGGWKYQQLDCPALPRHLFLRFTRDDDTRQMSMFSAAIPRDGNGRVHIIPIVRRGYSLFSPAPIAAMTIAAFNRIRSEEDAGSSADWLGTGLCYAALAGANPQLGIAWGSSEDHEMEPTISPTLMITGEGGAVIRFADVSAAFHAMEWNMTFDRKGKLIKATHAPASVARLGKVIPGPVEVHETKP